MEIKPIKTEADYEEALEQIAAVMSAEAGTPDGDRLELLSILVEAYEQKHYPIEAPDPVAAIEFAMEQQGLERKDIEPFIGTKGRVSEILSHKRPLTLPMIRKLHDGLGIPAEVLIAESGTRHSAA